MLSEDDISGFLDPEQMGRGGGIVAMAMGALVVGAAIATEEDRRTALAAIPRE